MRARVGELADVAHCTTTLLSSPSLLHHGVLSQHLGLHQKRPSSGIYPLDESNRRKHFVQSRWYSKAYFRNVAFINSKNSARGNLES